MKPTTRQATERRLEAMETRQAATQQMPELRLILDNKDGTKQIHILGSGGKFIVPAKMEPEVWMHKAQSTSKNR